MPTGVSSATSEACRVLEEHRNDFLPPLDPINPRHRIINYRATEAILNYLVIDEGSRRTLDEAVQEFRQGHGDMPLRYRHCAPCQKIRRDGCRRCGACMQHNDPHGVVEDCTCAHLCIECCACKEEDGSVSGGKKMHKQRGSRMAGVEVEYNSSKNFAPIRKWCNRWEAAVHSDGSCGWECVTSPASGKKLASQLTDLAGALSLARATIDNRCGVHVHVDARDMLPGKIRNLSYLYGLVEPAMYVLAGEHRVNQHYCRPNGKILYNAAIMPKGWTIAIYKAIYNMYSAGKPDVDRLLKSHPGKKGGTRYVGMNLCPWVSGMLGKKPDTTVEFRMHEGLYFGGGERLLAWTNLCVDLVDFAKNHKFADCQSLVPNTLSSTDALCRISPRSSGYMANRLREFRGDNDFIRIRRDVTFAAAAMRAVGTPVTLTTMRGVFNGDDDSYDYEIGT
jgi:hypothetical protein